MSDVATLAANPPAVNPLAAPALPANIETLVSAVMAVQARSLILNRQQQVAPFLDASPLSTRLSGLQLQLRAETRLVLDRLVPKAIRALSDANAGVALMTALPPSLAQPIGAAGGSSGSGKAAVQMLDAIADSFKSYQLNAAELAGAFSREAVTVSATVKALSAQLQQAADALDGPDGGISTTLAAIDKTEAAVAADIGNVVKSANSIGQGCKRLVTGILTTFDFAPGNDKKTPPADGGDHAKSTPAAKKPATASDINDAGEKVFPVEGLGAVSDGASGMSDAIRAWQKNNAKLAALYNTAARQNAGLAITTAALNQLDNYAASLAATAAAALTVAADWTGVVDGCSSYARQIAAANGGDSAVRLNGTVKDAIDHTWSRLAACIADCEGVLTGRSGFFPDAKSLLGQ